MKILYYNWDRIDGHTGGGVTVYQRNLLAEMSKRDDVELYFMNSGFLYDNKGLRVMKTENSFGERVQSYEIVNSPVLAPVQQSCKNLSIYLSDTKIVSIFREFIKERGPFAVIHFNNLEGLSLNVLHLKREFPQTMFVYSVHNYFPVCSRVNLWKDEMIGKGHNCDKKNYTECISCYRKTKYASQIIRRKTETLNIFQKKVFRVIAKCQEKIFPDSENVNIYQQFEEKTIHSLNENVDVILAVSARVKEIMVSHGIDGNKIKTSYIGTKVAEQVLNKCAFNPYSDVLQIIYMGYMNREKGFYFFLDALEKMPDKMANSISVKVVARHDKKQKSQEVERLKRLETKFKKIELINGYTAVNQKELLADVNLGIVPVQWEDNLPQVAIEQIAYGVPILVSDLGGAREIVKDENFIFHATDTCEFIKKLSAIQNNRQYLNAFWNVERRLVTMQEHINELLNTYGIIEKN